MILNVNSIIFRNLIENKVNRTEKLDKWNTLEIKFNPHVKFRIEHNTDTIAMCTNRFLA